ncbi:hypothetical protein ACIPPM_02560 [Streptomyces sp. NPDC090119]|uniref:hypothetical protein n=1 Tax=Streptomyces sp. NPDC090119 TaxID=3365951 RepID=UPI0037FF8F87
MTVDLASRSAGSGRVHGSYLRFPADLPVVGRRVVLCLRVRRFRCEDLACGRRTFVEQVAGLTRRYSRRTERMRSMPAEVGLALAGRAGARLADVFGARVSRNTVLRLVDVETRRPVDLGQSRNRQTGLDDFKPYLHERWAEGCTNAWTLWEEVKAHGYTGGYGAVRAYLQPCRTSPTAPVARPPSPRTVPGWILTHPDTLPERAYLKLKSVLADCHELDALTGHVRAFGKMLTQLQGDQLPRWTATVRTDHLPSLHTFVKGLERDLAADTAGLTLPWNSGMVEGHVNRIMLWNQRCQAVRLCITSR